MQGENKYNKNLQYAGKIISRLTNTKQELQEKISILTKIKQTYKRYFTVINTKLPNDKYV